MAQERGSADLLPEGPLLVSGLSAVAGAFDLIGYTTDAVGAVLGVAGDVPTAPADLVIYERRLAATSGALPDVVAVFVLGRRLPSDRLVTALGRPVVDALVDAGTLVEEHGAMTPVIRLIPHGELWIASDRSSAAGTRLGALHVTGINPPANLLAALTVHRGGGTALDVGTGNGIQSLLMARYCDRVVATDVNPRALAFTGFNAAVNGIDTIECRSGSLLEPVVAERFDLIVSNPPYVISPDHDLVFRDSGLEPGALCAQLVGGIPDHLANGGYSTVLASWPLRGEDPWPAVPTGWLSDGCRAWLLQLNVDDVLTHAGQWNSPLAVDGDLAAFGDAVARWVRYAVERGITRIGYGAVVMQQRASGCTVVRADEVRVGHGNATAHVERVFAASDLIPGLDDDALADLTCHLPPEHDVGRAIHVVDGEWRQGDTVVTLSEGVGIEATLDPLMAEVFVRVTSGMTVREGAEEAADLAGVPLEQRGDLLAAAAAMVRDLLSLGILVADKG